MIKIILLCSFFFGAFANNIPNPKLINNADLTLDGQYNFIAQMTVIQKSGAKLNGNAVLISSRHLIAKASDIANVQSIKLVLGALFPEKFEEEQQVFTVDESAVILPEETTKNYPGIIVLPTPVEITTRVQPALLPRWQDVGKLYAGTTGTVVKFSKHTGETRRVAYTDVTVMENKNCNIKTDDEYICAEYLADIDDSGAPLVMTDDDKNPLEVVGLFSYVSFLPRSGGSDGGVIPTNVYLKLNEHLQFISDNTGVYIRP